MSKFDQCYLRWRGKTSGPFTWAEIERKLDSHEIGLLHDLQQNNDWTTLGEYLAGRGDSVRVPPPVPITAASFSNPAATDPPPIIGQKFIRIPNRWIFIILGLFFGFAGLHDFYAHHWIRGALLLGIAALLYFANWGIIWPWLYALGEILLTKLDGQGRRMPWKRK